MTGVVRASGAPAVGAVEADAHLMPIFILFIAAACGIWYLIVVLVQAIGVSQVYVSRVFISAWLPLTII